MKEYIFLHRNPEYGSMIESSNYMCSKEGVDQHMLALPEITESDVERCKKLVSGHIRLMRRSTPDYYEAIKTVLSANKAVLLYIYTNFDVFGRYGNQQLKDELAAINIRLGTTLSEKNAGTNAAVMASRSPRNAWVIGDEHYVNVLKPYASYAFRIDGKYDRTGYIVLVTYKNNLDERIVNLFRLIETTECIITAGLVTKDVIMRDMMQRREYSKSRTDDIIIMVDNGGAVTFANDAYYDFYKSRPLETIDSPLLDLCPTLESLVTSIMAGKNETGSLVELVRPNLETEQFLADCTLINATNKQIGALITIYKPKAKATANASNENAAQYTFSDLLGKADNFVKLKHFAVQIAPTPSPILIQGESGTGKELFANSIHCASTRWNKPFVAINCAAIPKELIGSELFGYVGGSFTGASRGGAKGKFELADGGTLFLDEIGEMPFEMQSVLLRALEEKSITRIGATKPIRVDVRIISSTNKDLRKCISEGTFRADLYYRLNVVNLNMIPLRHRCEDIPVLAAHFMKEFAKANGKPMDGISAEAMQAMMEYKWPGNIRELRNAIEYGVLVSSREFIELNDLPENISHLELKEKVEEFSASPKFAEGEAIGDAYKKQRWELAERLLIELKGNKSRVAKRMGISRSTLYRILNDNIKE